MKVRAFVASAMIASGIFGVSTAGADVSVCYELHVLVNDQAVTQADCQVVATPAPPELPPGP